MRDLVGIMQSLLQASGAAVSSVTAQFRPVLAALGLFLLVLAAAYGAGRRAGRREGWAAGFREGYIILRNRALDDGVCPICSPSSPGRSHGRQPGDSPVRRPDQP